MKRMVVGLCLGLFIGLGAGALASTGEKVEATFVEYIYEVDGEIREIDTPALLYHGTSHLPVRQVANMLGFNVTYVSDSKTIRFTTPESEQIPAKAKAEGAREAVGGEERVEDIHIPTPPIEDQLKSVIHRLEDAEASLQITHKLMEVATNEQSRSIAEQQIAEIEQLIENLRQQKADLEAQLQAGK